MPESRRSGATGRTPGARTPVPVPHATAPTPDGLRLPALRPCRSPRNRPALLSRPAATSATRLGPAGAALKPRFKEHPHSESPGGRCLRGQPYYLAGRNRGGKTCLALTQTHWLMGCSARPCAGLDGSGFLKKGFASVPSISLNANRKTHDVLRQGCPSPSRALPRSLAMPAHQNDVFRCWCLQEAWPSCNSTPQLS